MAVFGLGLMALTSCEEQNPPERTSTTQNAQSPQQAGNVDLCDRKNLDTMCSRVCGDIIVEPGGNLKGCDELAVGFSYPNADGCKDDPEQNYCIKTNEFQPCEEYPEPGDLPHFACGQCVDGPYFDQQQKENKFSYYAKHAIACKCCNDEVVCGEFDLFKGKNVTGDPQKDKTTTFPGFMPNIVKQDCCGEQGYKIKYDASKSVPSKDIYYYKVTCLR
jgi:hypothetical protein